MGVSRPWLGLIEATCDEAEWQPGWQWPLNRGRMGWATGCITKPGSERRTHLLLVVRRRPLRVPAPGRRELCQWPCRSISASGCQMPAHASGSRGSSGRWYYWQYWYCHFALPVRSVAREPVSLRLTPEVTLYYQVRAASRNLQTRWWQHLGVKA